MWRWMFLVLALYAAPGAAQAPLQLYCARGTADYPDAEMTFHPEGSHVVDIVFVGYRPSRGRAEWALRDCLSTAAKVDSSRQIVARLWYRQRGWRSPREPLAPYSLASGSSVARASLSSVGTR
jgi:hypothetical protein